MIIIKKPKVKIVKDKALLTCEVLIGDQEEKIFYEINKEYSQYLCTERADAFVIATFYYAMKHHHDIKCEVAITTELYHNLTTYLIPTLAKHSNNLSQIKIHAKLIDTPIKTKGEVGTGMSCGIDSLHVLKNYLNPECSSYKITTLCLNNVGSFKAYQEKYKGIGTENARSQIIKKAKEVAKQVNLPLIITNSNIHEVFNDTYYRVHTFSNMFSVFLLQKYFSKYFYASSGYDLAYYNIIDNYKLDSAEYDLLNFYCLELPTLKIYPEGNEKSRLEKTIDIADFKLAQENLHVCIKDGINCGKCIKCKRTLLSLEAIGKLENFKKVFDIEYYKNNKNEYYDWLKKEVDKKNIMNTITYKLLEQKKGNTIYENIDKFNQKNIIIPEIDILSITIKKDGYVLNKKQNIKYDSNLYSRLLASFQLANLQNKEIKIPKYILDNVKIYYKNQKTLKRKIKYIKSILRKRKTKINIHDLIYFLLYKPSTSKNIMKFLRKQGYINNDLNNYSTTKDLADIFEKITNNQILKNILEVDKIKIKGKILKNNNFIKNCQDIYYKNDEYQNCLIAIDKNRYYFIGKTNDYIVAIVSNYHTKKIVYHDIETAYGLIKKLIETNK